MVRGWWASPHEEGASLAWSILWPAAWLWEQVRLTVAGTLEDLILWLTIPDDAAFAIAPGAHAFIEEALKESERRSKP